MVARILSWVRQSLWDYCWLRSLPNNTRVVPDICFLISKSLFSSAQCNLESVRPLEDWQARVSLEDVSSRMIDLFFDFRYFCCNRTIAVPCCSCCQAEHKAVTTAWLSAVSFGKEIPFFRNVVTSNKVIENLLVDCCPLFSIFAR